MNTWYPIPSQFQSVCYSQWVFFLGEVVNFCLVWSLVWLIAYPRARQNQQLPDLKPWPQLALTVWERQCLEDSEQKNHSTNEWINELINDESVHRTAPAKHRVFKNTVYFKNTKLFIFYTFDYTMHNTHSIQSTLHAHCNPIILRYLEATSDTLVNQTFYQMFNMFIIVWSI